MINFPSWEALTSSLRGRRRTDQHQEGGGSATPLDGVGSIPFPLPEACCLLHGTCFSLEVVASHPHLESVPQCMA